MVLLLLFISLVPAQLSADDEGSVTVVIYPVPASINVISPNGGESWKIGSKQIITWSSVSVTGKVNLELSRDNGATWATIIASTENDGNKDWKVNGPSTTNARIKVSSIINPAVFDLSNTDFHIG
jgi:hypothetical protein